MTITIPIRRALGTMIVYGYPRADLAGELAIAHRLGATHLEILPAWRSYPDPRELVARADNAGLTIHSAHGCWGGQTIQARQVDLASLDPTTLAASRREISRCIAWVHAAGGSFLVVHPGGLADPEEIDRRRGSLVESLDHLAGEAEAARIVVCVENMPPGVYPGSDMADLAGIVAEVANPSVALALDTGHAWIAGKRQAPADPSLGVTTRAAGRWLATTHVHDNNGRQDAHWPPGLGEVDWEGWVHHLDAIDYRGPIILECIRYLRDSPEVIDEGFLQRLAKLTGLDRS